MNLEEVKERYINGEYKSRYEYRDGDVTLLSLKLFIRLVKIV